MPTTLNVHAMEKGTLAVTIAFKDENGVAVVPNAGLNWTLTDVVGTVVNSRSAVSITPGSSVTVVLTGSDLALTGSSDAERILTIEGTFDGSLGSNLPIKEECRFTIVNLTKVT